MARTQAGSDQVKGVDLSGTTDDVTGTLTVGNGGTGNSTNTLGSVLVGNGTGAITGVAPSTAGNALVSNGSAWTSARVSALTDPIFTAQASPTYAAGKLVYDTGNEALTFYNNESSVAMQIGQENWIRVRNVTGSTIANGVPVYVNGTDSGWGTIAPAKADAWNTSVIVGLTTMSIPTATTGWVTVTGEVRNLDTSGYTAGALVYVSAATAGVLTATAPTSPNYVSIVGRVTVSNATTGRIHVLQTQPSATTSAARYSQVSNVTSLTPNVASYDYIEDTGLTGAVTINNHTGTPVPGQRLWISLTGTAARAISHGTGYEASTTALPTTTSGTARLDIGYVWNAATSKWRCVAVA